MAKRKRGRATGRFEAGELFAAISVEIMRSDAYGVLPDYAIRTLLAVAAQYRGRNNGGLSLAIKTAREYGIRSAWKVQAGLRLLLDTGLVELTRPGKYSHGRGICALYALTWRVVNITPDAFPPIEHERPAPNTWTKWARPEDWHTHETDVRRVAQGATRKLATLHDHSRRQEQASSRRQEQGTASSATTSSRRREQETPVSNSRRLGDLLDSGRGARNPSRRNRPVSTQSDPGALDIDGKIVTFIRVQPHLTDSDVARVFAQFNVTAERVAAVRAGGAS